MNAEENIVPLVDAVFTAGQLIEQKDWREAGLGPPADWPMALRNAVNLALNSQFPMFVAWGPEHIFIYNDAYAEILGARHPQAMGARFQHVWSEIWDQIDPIVQQSMRGVSSYWKNLPLSISRKGYIEETWFTFSYSPVHDERGTVAGMFCVCIETTNEVLAERHREKELERMRELFRQAPGFTAVVREPHHVFELANDAFLNLIGQRDVLGKSLQLAIPELADQCFAKALDKVFQKGEPYVGKAILLKLQRVAGQPLEQRHVDFVYQPIRDFHGRVSGVFIQGNDVTDAVRSEKALRDSEQRLRQLADTIPQLAWMVNPDGTAHWYNERWYDYTRASADTMRTCGWESFCAPPAREQVRRQWQDAIRRGVAFEGTFALRSGADAYRTFYTRMVPLSDLDGKVVQWFGTATDVTVLEDAKNDLIASNSRKDEFLAMLAHELRNPLAPIRTAAELLSIEGISRDKVIRACDIIGRQIGNLTRQLDDLLDVAHVNRGRVTIHPAPCTLAELVGEAVEQIGPHFRAKQQHFSVALPSEPCSLHADKVRIVQLLANILDNASKYTPVSGAINLRAILEPDSVVLTVEDNGIGIDPQLRPHIFELFTQARRSSDRSQGGLGLGLALVRTLAQLHGGTVDAYSAGLGAGSRFTVTLPRLHEPAAPAASLPDQVTLSAGPGGLRVAVVDDNQDAAQTIADLLVASGHETHAVFSSSAALALAGEVELDAFILDVGLPDMDGCELARSLRANPRTARCLLIALTGYGQADDRHRTAQAGFDLHLVKPVQFQLVLDALTHRRTGATTINA